MSQNELHRTTSPLEQALAPYSTHGGSSVLIDILGQESEFRSFTEGAPNRDELINALGQAGQMITEQMDTIGPNEKTLQSLERLELERHILASKLLGREDKDIASEEYVRRAIADTNEYGHWLCFGITRSHSLTIKADVALPYYEIRDGSIVRDEERIIHLQALASTNTTSK